MLLLNVPLSLTNKEIEFPLVSTPELQIEFVIATAFTNIVYPEPWSLHEPSTLSKGCVLVATAVDMSLLHACTAGTATHQGLCVWQSQEEWVAALRPIASGEQHHSGPAALAAITQCGHCS